MPKIRVVSLLAASALAIGSAHAQAPVPPVQVSMRAGQPEERAREAAERDLRAAEERQEAQTSGTGGIAFERVLAAPEDVQLNLAYAREQIAAGDLKEGAATLERILLLQPALHDVRVLYGLVLYRLGLLDRARYEIEKALQSSALDPTVRAEAEVYLERIKRLQRSTRGSITLTAGVEWDDNRNQSPSDGIVLFNIPLLGTFPADAAPPDSDLATITSLQGRISHDLGFQAGHTAHAELSYYRSDKQSVDTLDIDAIAFSAGTTWNFGDFSVTPKFRASGVWLSGEEYLRTVGGELELLYRVNPRLRTYLNLRADHEDFMATSDFGAADLRTGRRVSAKPGVSWNFTPTMALTVEALWMNKQGRPGEFGLEFESYDRYGAFAQHTWLHGHGAFTLISGWAERSNYEDPDPFVSATTREEWLYRGRVTAGAPISWFARGVDLPQVVSTINVIAQYEYETVDSNIPNFEYDTHKVSLLLSKRVSF